MKVTIIGSGLSAAYAVQAAHDFGLKKGEIIVMSPQEPEFKPNGAQWLHWIPKSVSELTKQPPICILSASKGTEEHYLRKQWNRSDTSSSYPRFPRIEYGWETFYANHMMHWADFIRLNKPMSDEDIAYMAKGNHIVLHTFPTELSKKNSTGAMVEIPIYSVKLDDFEDHVNLMVDRMGLYVGWKNFDGIVVYDGVFNTTSVRTSLLEGYYCMEYSSARKDCVPFRTYRDLSPFAQMPDNPKIADNVYPIGRYAEWDRKILSHHAYFKTFSLIRKHTTIE